MPTKAVKCVRPIFSLDAKEARTRVLGLYRVYYRYIPFIVKYFDIPKNELQCKNKIRQNFYKHANVTDVRIIDILVHKGYIELNEMTHVWAQKHHVMYHWRPTKEPLPNTFLEKFFSGI